MRVKQLGIEIDHFTLLGEEASFLHGIDRQILKELQRLEYSESFVNSTIFTNKKRRNKDSCNNYNETLFPVEVRIE